MILLTISVINMYGCGYRAGVIHCLVYCIQHTYEEIIEWYKGVANQFSEIVKYDTSIGLSYEGRNQPAVRITGSSNPDVLKM